jgi:hypothetical protein
MAGKFSAAPVQRREDNPHAQAGPKASGHSATAHHIIGHAKLTEAMNDDTEKGDVILSEEDRLEVYISAIPEKLTAEMMTNLKVDLPEDPEARAAELLSIRERLVDPEHTADIGGIRVADIRGSFFEWMGGNQFLGPNTSVRAEPDKDKDALDTDGKYIFGDEHGDQMNALGSALYEELAGEKSPAEIKKLLLQITALAKDVAAMPFDLDQWTEVTDPAELPTLQARLGRTHMPSYTFLKVPAPSGAATFADPFGLLRATLAGGGDIKYGDKDAPAILDVGYAYFNYDASKKIITSPVVKMSVEAAILELSQKDAGAVFTEIDENSVQIAGSEKGLFKTFPMRGGAGFRFNDTTYKAQGALPMVDKDTLVVAKSTLALEITKTQAAQDLQTYLLAKNANISTWLPKRLYDSVMAV